MRSISCIECNHKQAFINYGTKSKWCDKENCIVYYNDESAEWLVKPEQTCEKCGSTKMDLNIRNINIDKTSELRDSSHSRYWKNNMTASQQADVIAGFKNPY
jgi:hypothetical protein